MNGTFTMLAFAMAGLGGVTPPEHIPPAPVPEAAYQGLDCVDLMRAAEVVDEDLADAWDRHEVLVRHRFGAPPPIVRRSENRVAQLKGELEAIWQVADRKHCGDAAEASDLAWIPGREPGPMLGEPRERPRYEDDEPDAGDLGPEADAVYGDEPAPGFDEPAYADEPADLAAAEDDLAGPGLDEPAEVDGYGETEDAAPPVLGPRDPGPARWPSAGERAAPSAAPARGLDDVDWPTAEAPDDDGD